MHTTNDDSSLSIIALSKISLPELVVIPSQYGIEQIVTSFAPDAGTDELSIKVVESKNGYVLVDGIDVYYAAKKMRLKEINAYVVNDSVDPQITYIRYTKKDQQNPIKIVRQMRRYVKDNGLPKTMQMMHLEPVYSKVYALEFDTKLEDTLDELFDTAYSNGVRSTAPLPMLRFICNLDEDAQHVVIGKLQKHAKENSGYRWPHNEFLKDMIPESDNPSKSEGEKKQDTASSEVTTFECTKCKTPHLVHDGRVAPYKEQSGLKIMEGDIADPMISLGKKHAKHLGIDLGDVPEVITSESDWKSVTSKMRGRKFVVLLGAEFNPS